MWGCCRSLSKLYDICRIFTLQPCLDAVVAFWMFLIAFDSAPFAVVAAAARLGVSLPRDRLTRLRRPTIWSIVRRRGRVTGCTRGILQAVIPGRQHDVHMEWSQHARRERPSLGAIYTSPGVTCSDPCQVDHQIWGLRPGAWNETSRVRGRQVRELDSPDSQPYAVRIKHSGE